VSRSGLGVGLSLVRRLTILHGGTVTAASPGAGRGSTFTVRLPRVPAPDSTAAAPRPPEAAAQACRVLVVDDHHDGRRMLSVMLNLFGYQALEAHDGADGLRIAAAELPDVAIIDIGLPGIDGYEVARRLRADPQTRKIGLIALTGHGQEEDRRRALEAGFDVHLVKPVNPDLLNEEVEALRGKAR
jgi:CheY-like chemotaxis protein